MNERMIELANKANTQVGYTFKLEDANQIHELMEKFAVLIVRECAEVAVDHDPLWGASVDQDIKRHFGVKE